MATLATTKLEVPVVYNGVTRSIEAQPHERVVALLQRAIQTFGITQQPHLLSLFREDGTKVEEHQSVEEAGLGTSTLLLLRPDAVKGGETCSS